MTKTAFILLNLIFAVGCASQNTAPSHLGRKTAYLLGDVVVPSKGYRLCQIDADCVIIETDCASGCGRSSVSRRWASEFLSKWFEPVCLQEWKGQMCASAECKAKRCPVVTARCTRGLCSEPDEPVPPDLAPIETLE